MKAVIEIDFNSSDLALKALRVIGKKNESKNAVVTGVQKGKILVFTVEAKNFTALRALTTTLFRDLKLFMDSINFV
ncbi:MAG: KEOPS complex subunit Pcc1 [Candidatus Micrarchaeota archaeon]